MIGTDISRAKALLEAGLLVAIPTETVYGLAANALNPDAVAAIFQAKNRPHFDPLIIHTSPMERVVDWVEEFPAEARLLARSFWPGPLTLLLPKKAIIPDLVTSGSPRVAIRIPRHPLTQALLESISFPLAAPSANPFGYVSPTTAQHVADQLGDRLAYILDGGPCQVGIESTIVGWEEGRAVIYRKGGIPVEVIEKKIGKVAVKPHSTSRPQAPGMLQSHYATRTPIRISDFQTIKWDTMGTRIGIIAFRQPVSGIPLEYQVVLSHRGDYAEAARNLFAGLRRLDDLNLDLILAELLPEEDLGRAINDRLRRAAAN